VRRAGLAGHERGELDAAIAAALAYDGPSLVEVMSDPDLV